MRLIAARARGANFIALAAITLFVAVECPWRTPLAKAKVGAGAFLLVALLANEELS